MSFPAKYKGKNVARLKTEKSKTDAFIKAAVKNAEDAKKKAAQKR